MKVGGIARVTFEIRINIDNVDPQASVSALRIQLARELEPIRSRMKEAGGEDVQVASAVIAEIKVFTE